MAKLAVAQICCEVGNISANVGKAKGLIEEAALKGAELICLPECFSTGEIGDGAGDLAEPVPGPTTESLSEVAAANGIYVVAGIVEKEITTGNIHNSSVLISPEGRLEAKYRKVYLYLGERENFTPGDKACVQDIGFCRAALTICYDYVFPEYIYGLVLRGANLLIHSTAWVTTDECEKWNYNRNSYRAMGMARALENTVFFMSANHCGNYDAEGALRAIGDSAIISPWGEILAEIKEGEGVAVAEADFSRIAGWQEAAAPYLADRDTFGVAP